MALNVNASTFAPQAFHLSLHLPHADRKNEDGEICILKDKGREFPPPPRMQWSPLSNGTLLRGQRSWALEFGFICVPRHYLPWEMERWMC